MVVSLPVWRTAEHLGSEKSPAFCLPSFHQSSISPFSKSSPRCSSPGTKGTVNAPTSAAGGQPSSTPLEASAVDTWPASTSEHSSSLEIHAQNRLPSECCWLHSRVGRKGRGRTAPENRHNNIKSLEKNISVSSHLLATSPP